jgi:hypothetical protein
MGLLSLSVLLLLLLRLPLCLRLRLQSLAAALPQASSRIGRVAAESAHPRCRRWRFRPG